MKGKMNGKWGLIGSMMALVALLLLTMGAHQRSTGLYVTLAAEAEFEMVFHGSGRLNRIEAKNATAKAMLSTLNLADDQAESVLDALLDGLRSGGQLTVAEEIVVGIAAKEASQPLAERVRTHVKGKMAAMAQTDRLRIVEFPWTSVTENRARAANASMTELVQRDHGSDIHQEMAVESLETGIKLDESPESAREKLTEPPSPGEAHVTGESPSREAEATDSVLRMTVKEVWHRQSGQSSEGGASLDFESPDTESPDESPDFESPDFESPDESPDFESPDESPDF